MVEEKACRELTKILGKEYLGNKKFKTEFIAALNRKTGNNNFGKLCEIIVNNQSYPNKKL